jgi:hypothetical protein
VACLFTIRCSRNQNELDIIDFNQGVDARCIDIPKMKKIAETAIHPLRIAFDNYSLKDKYEKAVKLVTKKGLKFIKLSAL